MEKLQAYLPKPLMEMIDDLVARGIYPSRQEVVREALAKYLPRVLRRIQRFEAEKYADGGGGREALPNSL